VTDVVVSPMDNASLWPRSVGGAGGGSDAFWLALGDRDAAPAATDPATPEPAPRPAPVTAPAPATPSPLLNERLVTFLGVNATRAYANAAAAAAAGNVDVALAAYLGIASIAPAGGRWETTAAPTPPSRLATVEQYAVYAAAGIVVVVLCFVLWRMLRPADTDMPAPAYAPLPAPPPAQDSQLSRANDYGTGTKNLQYSRPTSSSRF
jgi:hypothetical protein